MDIPLTEIDIYLNVPNYSTWNGFYTVSLHYVSLDLFLIS